MLTYFHEYQYAFRSFKDFDYEASKTVRFDYLLPLLNGKGLVHNPPGIADVFHLLETALRLFVSETWCEDSSGVLGDASGLFNPFSRITKRDLVRKLAEFAKTFAADADYVGLKFFAVRPDAEYDPYYTTSDYTNIFAAVFGSLGVVRESDPETVSRYPSKEDFEKIYTDIDGLRRFIIPVGRCSSYEALNATFAKRDRPGGDPHLLLGPYTGRGGKWTRTIRTKFADGWDEQTSDGSANRLVVSMAWTNGELTHIDTIAPDSGPYVEINRTSSQANPSSNYCIGQYIMKTGSPCLLTTYTMWGAATIGGKRELFGTVSGMWTFELVPTYDHTWEVVGFNLANLAEGPLIELYAERYPDFYRNKIEFEVIFETTMAVDTGEITLPTKIPND